MRHRPRLLPVVVALLVAALALPAKAREIFSKEIPVLITADEISYDRELGTVTARGRVEITQGERTLLADTVSYNQNTDTVSASGNVVLHEPSGEVLFAEYVELTDALKNGVIENIRMLLADDSRFAAVEAERRDGRRTIMRRAVYSPCKTCQEHPKRPLLWQIKAERVEHDKDAREVRYRNVVLEMFGVPVAYTPYFSHPDPTVDRKTGFLTPEFSTGGPVGTSVRLPYFIVIDDSKDLTVTPIYTGDEGLVLSGEYRQRFNNGELSLSGSATEADRSEGSASNPTVKRDRLRGHIKARARFDLDDTWRAGADIERATDRTYLRRFDFFGAKGSNSLTSNLYVEGFRRRNYLIVQGYAFQDLRTDSGVEQPLVGPIIEYSHLGEADRFGGRWGLDAGLRYLDRDSGPDSLRFSVRPEYRISHTAKAGFVTTLSGSVEADVYNIDRATTSTRSDGIAGRILPRISLDWRYPFVRQSGPIRQLVEPIVFAVATPNGSNPDDIPDEDSTVYEIDDTNLLSEDRFPGLDRIETGQRIVYGVKLGLFGLQNERLTGFIGQSVRFHDDEELRRSKLLERDFSDVVGRIEARPNEYIDILYRFRFAKNDLATQRSTVDFSVGPAAFRLFGNYLFVDDGATTGGFGEREELTIGFTSKVTDTWTVTAMTRRDLTTNGGTLQHTLGLRYEDECFILRATASRSFTRDADIEPSDQILFQLVFKTFGQSTAIGG